MSDGTRHRPGLSVVTGATSGFGREVARHLAVRGADLVVVVRDEERGADLLADLPSGGERHLVVADLSSIARVAAAADEIRSLGRPVSLLVNNAGAVFGLRRRESVDGIELTMALNHLAYFELTTGLLSRLGEAGGRVVNVASDAYTFAGGRLDPDTALAETGYRPHRQYGRSKLANILFTHELQRRHEADGVETVAWSPDGLTATRFGYGANRLGPLLMKLTHPFAATTEDAVPPLLDLCVTDDLGDRTGRFVHGSEVELVPECRDDDAERLWIWSRELAAEARRTAG